MVEGARLESVFRGNSNVGSNPTLSAIEKSKLPCVVGRYGAAQRFHSLLDSPSPNFNTAPQSFLEYPIQCGYRMIRLLRNPQEKYETNHQILKGRS